MVKMAHSGSRDKEKGCPNIGVMGCTGKEDNKDPSFERALYIELRMEYECDIVAVGNGEEQ